MVIKCPYCGCYVEPEFWNYGYRGILIKIICPACGMELSSKDLERAENKGDEEDDDD